MDTSEVLLHTWTMVLHQHPSHACSSFRCYVLTDFLPFVYVLFQLQPFLVSGHINTAHLARIALKKCIFYRPTGIYVLCSVELYEILHGEMAAVHC